MKNEYKLPAHYPTSVRFQQIAIDNAQNEFELKQLELAHRAERVHYKLKIAELEQLSQDLHEHINQPSSNDDDENNRLERIKELMEQISAYELPEPINLQLYKIRKSILEHKLRESAHMSTTILIWQAQNSPN